MNREQNKYLTEKMGGCAQDEGLFRDSGYLCCVKCNQIVNRGMTPCLGVTDFSTPDGFLKLWNWAKEQKWWKSFVYNMNDIDDVYHINTVMIDPDIFANAVYNYLNKEIK